MGLDIFFSEDIRNALLAANEASASTAAIIAEVQGADAPDLVIVALRAYRRGFKAALVTVALAFGIAPQIFGLPTKEREAALPPAPPQRGEP